MPHFDIVKKSHIKKTYRVARTISKAVRRENKQFVAITCHKDVIEWLQPDWVLDTNTMKCFFTTAHDPKNNISFGSVGETNGKSLGVITI